MNETVKTEKTLFESIRTRRTIRSFTKEEPKKEDIARIVEAGLYAPYAGLANIPFEQQRKIFIFRQGTKKMENVKNILLSQIRTNSSRLNMLLFFLPFLKKKMQAFANRLKGVSVAGIPSLNDAPYYIIVAEKKGFPPVERESLGHCMQNMWLAAVELGLGFQLITASGLLSKNKEINELMGITAGEYEFNGCAIGYAGNGPGDKNEIDPQKHICWIE